MAEKWRSRPHRRGNNRGGVNGVAEAVEVCRQRPVIVRGARVISAPRRLLRSCPFLLVGARHHIRRLSKDDGCQKEREERE